MTQEQQPTTHEQQPRLIAITGGPCSGKSKLLEHLQSSNLAEYSVFVPEAATIVLPGFLAARSETETAWDSPWQFNLQKSISALQISLEDTYIDYASATGKKFVICDRGTCDAEAYTKNAQDIYQSLGHTALGLLSRYHAVIHLESLATVTPELFTSDNNPQRYEDVQTAAELEFKTRDAWAGHPKWKFIPGHEDITTKLQAAAEAIQAAVSEP